MKRKVGVLISGRGSNLQALIAARRTPGYPADIALVISNRADAYGLTLAKQARIPTAIIPHAAHPTREAFEAAIHEQLQKKSVELVCLAGFMRVLSPSFVKMWENRMLNIHPSLLPSFTGLGTHARAIAAGVRFSGCTVHFVSPELDSGPIIMQAAVPVHPQDTPDALAARVLKAEHRCYPAALRLLAENRLRIEDNRVLIDGHLAPVDTVLNPAGYYMPETAANESP
jgi:phosphoribosylglycinamide formyltransferase-1